MERREILCPPGGRDWRAADAPCTRREGAPRELPGLQLKLAMGRVAW